MTDTKASLTRRGLDSLVCTALNNRSVIEEMGGDCKEFHLRLVLHNGLSKCLEHCDLLRNCAEVLLLALTFRRSATSTMKTRVSHTGQ